MKLKQIKPFNAQTVTQEIAAEICAIACWNHLNESRYANKFVIKDAEPKGVCKGGSTYPWKEEDAERGYVKTATGVHITTPVYQKVRIFECGALISKYIDNEHSEYELVSRNKKTGRERIQQSQGRMNFQVKLIQYYIDAGFFTIKQ